MKLLEIYRGGLTLLLSAIRTPYSSYVEEEKRKRKMLEFAD
jgi:hypothetical protein